MLTAAVFELVKQFCATEIGRVHLTGQKKLGCMHCIMFVSYPM